MGTRPISKATLVVGGQQVGASVEARANPPPLTDPVDHAIRHAKERFDSALELLEETALNGGLAPKEASELMRLSAAIGSHIDVELRLTRGHHRGPPGEGRLCGYGGPVQAGGGLRDGETDP